MHTEFWPQSYFTVGRGGAGDLQAKLAQLHAQSLAGDAQQNCGPVLVPAGVLHDAGEHEPIQLPVALPVHVTGFGAKPLTEKRLRIETPRWGRQPRPSLRRLGRLTHPQRDDSSPTILQALRAGVTSSLEVTTMPIFMEGLHRSP